MTFALVVTLYAKEKKAQIINNLIHNILYL